MTYEAQTKNRVSNIQPGDLASIAAQYEQVLKNPSYLEGLTKSQALNFFALACYAHSQQPDLFEGMGERPNNGFLAILVENNPYLKKDSHGRDEAIRAARLFNASDLAAMVEQGGEPLDYQRANIFERLKSGESNGDSRRRTGGRKEPVNHYASEMDAAMKIYNDMSLGGSKPVWQDL